VNITSEGVVSSLEKEPLRLNSENIRQVSGPESYPRKVTLVLYYGLSLTLKEAFALTHWSTSWLIYDYLLCASVDGLR
jgi:hypothetical protein